MKPAAKQPEWIEPPEYPERPDLAVTALLYLLTRFSMTPCAHKADAILSHLQLVAGDARNASELRATAQQLAREWRQRFAGVDTSTSVHLH